MKYLSDIRSATRRVPIRRPGGDRSDGVSREAVAVLDRTAITGNLLVLRLVRPPGFAYRAGQHVKLGVPGLMRNYSFVSAPHQRDLEFFVELFPYGRLSERLRTVRPGEVLVLAQQPKGDLRFDPRFPNQLCIGTVTGIAPYVSMLRDHLHRRPPSPRRVVVLHGASYASELGYRGELTELAARQPQTLAYLPTVSRPADPRNAGWNGARGRVEGHLDDVLRRFALTPADTAAFACGHPEMVRNTAAELDRRGFTTATEPFD
ncbi:MAG TPA: FAD-binding oxidoreductase [Pseudomonadales bacterium]